MSTTRLSGLFGLRVLLLTIITCIGTTLRDYHRGIYIEFVVVDGFDAVPVTDQRNTLGLKEESALFTGSNGRCWPQSYSGRGTCRMVFLTW